MYICSRGQRNSLTGPVAGMLRKSCKAVKDRALAYVGVAYQSDIFDRHTYTPNRKFSHKT